MLWVCYKSNLRSVAALNNKDPNIYCFFALEVLSFGELFTFAIQIWIPCQTDL